MRKPVISGMLLAATLIAVNTSKAQALDPSKLLVIEKPNTNSAQTIDEPINKTITETIFKTASVQNTVAAPEVSNETKYKIAEGDTLSSIATKYSTTWDKLYFKNTQIEIPDFIKPNDEIVIPKPDEQLTPRVIPAPKPVPAAAVIEKPTTTQTYRSAPKPKATAPSTYSAPAQARGSASGNTYTYGYCTWYVKNLRPDLPNNLGNADTWASRAAAQGIPTGSAPRAGAVGQAGMHVVYVLSVNGDGTVNITEMNHAGWNVVSNRTVPASMFRYIY